MRKLGRKLTSALLTLALLVSLLPIGAAPAQAADTPHDISQGTLTITQDGNYTVTGTTPVNNIVVEEDVTATVTLNNVNITGTGNDSYGTSTPVTSPIDLSAGATLTLILGDNSTNTLTGGAGGGGNGAPGIHVPDDAALIVQGGGSLTVTGGSSSTVYGGIGIGGAAEQVGSIQGKGEDCGTVIILSTGNVEVKGGSGSANSTADDIGGGEGYHHGGNGQGIRPSGNNTYTIWGSLTLPCDVTIPDGATVAIPDYTGLTVPQDVTLTNNGTIVKDDFGSFINNGTVTGQQPDDDRYSIDYEFEMIKINDGYVVYTEETGGTPLYSIDSITNYIGQSLYIQQAGSSERTEIKIPDRPAAPTVTASIDYDEEKISFPSGVTTANLEYAFSSTALSWEDVPDDAALSGMEWDGTETKNYYFRTKATDSSFASASNSTYVEAKARPSAPSFSPTVTKTANSITISPVAKNQEYRIYPSNSTPGEWETLSATDSSYTWENLQPGTEYTIETRIKAGPDASYQDQFASWPANITVTTERADSALTVEPSSTELTYGDTLTITVTPEQTADTNTLNTLEDTVELYIGNKLLVANAGQGPYTLIYDTKEQDLSIGEIILTVSYGGSGSLNPSTAQVTVTLETRDVTATLDGTTSKPYDGTTAAPEGLTLALPGVLEGDTVTVTGTIAYDTKDVGTGKTITASNLTLTGNDARYYDLAANDIVENNGSITAADLSGTVTITGTAQYNQQLTASYDPVHDDEQVTYQWNRGDQPISGAIGSTYTLTEADIGKSITATATDSNHTGSVTSTAVTVGKAPQTALTISGLPDKVYVGDQFTLTASGGTGTGALSWEVVSGPAEIDASTGAVRVTGEGEIVIRATKEADATHSATSAEITFTANEIPYTGKYSYEISTDIGDNGTLSVDRYATEGDKVTITVSPDDAYKLDDLSVTAHGKEVELTANDDGTFTFTMPSGDVKISATFVEDPDWTPDEPEEPTTDVSEIFIDVAPNAWYKDAVQYANDNGLMTGVSANEFAPEATTTRAMIVSILARLEGVTTAQAAGFADVNDEWYATAVNWAANVGVVNGYEDNTFRPNQPITREQLAAILMNYAAYKGEE